MNSGTSARTTSARRRDRLRRCRRQGGHPLLPHQAGHEVPHALLRRRPSRQTGGRRLQDGVQLGRQRSDDGLVDDRRPHHRRARPWPGPARGWRHRTPRRRSASPIPRAASSPSRSPTCVRDRRRPRPDARRSPARSPGGGAPAPGGRRPGPTATSAKAHAPIPTPCTRTTTGPSPTSDVAEGSHQPVRHRSTAQPTATIRSSRHGAATSCTPTGSPPAHPHGTETAGKPGEAPRDGVAGQEHQVAGEVGEGRRHRRARWAWPARRGRRRPPAARRPGRPAGSGRRDSRSPTAPPPPRAGRRPRPSRGTGRGPGGGGTRPPRTG